MSQATLGVASFRARLLRLGRRYGEEFGPGFAVSLFLHGLVIFLALFFFMRHAEPPVATVLHVVSVDVLRLGEETTSPPAEQKSIVPQQKARSRAVEAQTPVPPEGVSPHGTRPPVDALEAKLRGFARLKTPDTPLHLTNTTGQSDVDAESDDAAAGDEALYAVKDFIRAQTERRWSLNVRMLGSRTYLIPLHVVMKRDGTVVSVEIVDRERFTNDAAYHEIALSARNAVLLSSPYALPSGVDSEKMDFVLDLNPRDTLR